MCKVVSVVRATSDLSGAKSLLSLGRTLTICNVEGIGFDEFVQLFLQIQRCLGLGIHEKVWVKDNYGGDGDPSPLQISPPELDC